MWRETLVSPFTQRTPSRVFGVLFCWDEAKGGLVPDFAPSQERMLKKHQVIRAIRSSLRGRSDLTLLATIGETSYFLDRQEEREPPQYRLLRLRIDKDEREVKVHAGLSYFDVCQEIVLAPSFTRWQPVNMGELPARSKQTLRKAIKKVVSGFRPESHGRYSVLAANTVDEATKTVFAFFTSHRRELAEREPTSLEQLKKLASSTQFTELCRLADLGETERDDDELESLLDSLGADGAFSGSSSFSLNQEKALQKLSDFQLGERYLFPLFLAAGLSLQGARGLEIEIDSDEMWVRFQDCPFDSGRLQSLTSLLLGGVVSRDHRGFKMIAQALLQGARRNPSALELQLSDTTLDLRGFPEITTPEFSGESGVFYCKVPLSMKVATRFWKSLQSGHAELDHLSQALAFLPTPWSLNGEPQTVSLPINHQSILFEWRHEDAGPLPLDTDDCLLHSCLELDLQGRVLMIVTPQQEPELTVIVDGLTAECPVPLEQSRVQTFLWLSDMTTDLSGQKLVHTQLLDEILESVIKLEEKIPELVAANFAQLPDSEKAKWHPTLLQLMVRAIPWRPALMTLPCLPVIGAKRWSTVADLRAASPAYFTNEEFARGLRSGDSVVKVDPAALRDFRHLLPDNADATRTLRSHQRYYERLEQWRQTPNQEAALPSSPDSLKISLLESVGEIGFTPERTSSTRLLCEYRPLPVEIGHWVPDFVGLVVNHDDLEMNDAWTELETRSLEETLKQDVLESLKRLVSRLARGDFEVELHRQQMRSALTFLKRHGQNLATWEEVEFIQETHTEIDSSGPVPLPRRVLRYFNLKQRPDYLD